MQTVDIQERLDPNFQDRIDREILRRVRSAVAHNRDRDDLLRSYADQADGLGQPYSDGPWANSCQLEDPMTDEHCTQLTAYLMASLRTEPFCLIEATTPGDEAAAARLELALNAKAQQWELSTKLYDVVYNAVRYPYAPAAINWKQEIKKRRTPGLDANALPPAAPGGLAGGNAYPPSMPPMPQGPFPPQGPLPPGMMPPGLMSPDLMPPGMPPSGPQALPAAAEWMPPMPAGSGQSLPPYAPPGPFPEPMGMPEPEERYEVVAQGPEIRAITPDNFYLYPPTAQDIDRAQQVVERMYFTAEDLALGVGKYGFDPEEVRELLKAGGTDAPSRERIDGSANENDGQSEDYEDALYECFLVTGRMPMLFDEEGDIETPEEYLDEDFVWLVCPDRNSVFHFGACPYTVRPYAVFHISRKPNRLMGRCVPAYLETLQEESTANLRFKIDILNLIANPVLKVRNDYEDMDGDELFPGKKLRYQQSPNEIEPLVMSFNGFQALTAQQAELQNRADKLMSAPGADQVEPRASPMSATQAGMIGASLSLKRDLFLQTFQETGGVRLYQLLIAIWLQHLPEEGEQVVSRRTALPGLPPGPGEESSGMDVTPEDLERRYRFIPHANSDAANPQLRLQMTMAKQNQQQSYFQGLANLPPDKWPLLYHGSRRFFEDTNERNVEAWIGKEPSPGDPGMVLQRTLQMLGQAAQQGDANAGQILQQVQGLMKG